MTKQTAIEAGSLSAALVAALAEIEGAAKDKVNPHFKSKYADIGSVIDAIKPVLARFELGFTQHPQPSDSGIIIETMLHHVSGQTLSMGTLYVPANKLDPQAFGSALTYARRYALMTAFGVPAEDDDGNAAARPAEPQREKVNGISKIKDRLNQLMIAGDKETDLEKFNRLVNSYKNDLQEVKDANHVYWTGGGEDSEGFKTWIVRRRAELAPIEMGETGQMCLDTLNECTNIKELEGWFKLNWKYVEELDGAERDKVEARYVELETALKSPDYVSAG